MRNKALFLIIPLAILIAVGAAGALWMNTSSETSEVTGDIAANPEDVMTIRDEQGITPAAGEGDAAAAPAAAPAHAIVVEGSDPKAPRSLGSIDAPVTINDYSSLTCPHCANAHANVLPQLIRDYVDTGKVRIVFNDFPLNQQAMDASKVSRCMPNDQYFSFLSLLFSSIEQWSTNHPNALIQNAVLAGLPEDKARACMADTEVETAIIEGVRAAAMKYQINATPTFVLNDGARVISGARPYGEFKAAIDGLLSAQ